MAFVSQHRKHPRPPDGGMDLSLQGDDSTRLQLPFDKRRGNTGETPHQSNEARAFSRMSGASDYRALASTMSPKLTKWQRAGLVVISRALADAAPRPSDQMKRACAQLGNEVLKWENGGAKADVNRLVGLLHPEASQAIYALRVCKAELLARILTTNDVNPDVKDIVYCHAATKVPITRDGCNALAAYVKRLQSERPTMAVMEGADPDNDWFPAFGR